MGKSSTTTQSVSIPPEVMARYNAVNASAEKVAATPFQKYSDDPNAFVAPLNSTQILGIQQAGGYAQAAQPAFAGALRLSGESYNDAMTRSAASMQPMMQGYNQAQDAYGAAANQYGQAAQSAYPYMTRAESGIYGGLMAGQDASRQAMQYGLGAGAAASPYYQAATQGTQAGLAAASPYNQMATMAAMQGAQGISPEQFSGAAVERYMSPYLSNVVGQTMKAQAQQNAQQRQALSADAIRAGAFGGDRAGIAQANLAYQQNLANQQTIGNLLQGGYGQALGAFQQQQGVNLQAEQANRAAQQQLAQQALAIGQQGYGQQLGAAQQMAGLGQALYGQQMGTGQFIQGLGAQNYQQQLGAAQAQQGLGQMLSGLGFQTGQAYQGLGAQQAQTGLATSQQQAALANQMYGMGSNTAQLQANLGAGAQSAALQGAQAAIQAGTLAQQTEQAGKQALYNQFLQQQSYPFQVQQFLANIAMGTGALSGSTTTTTSPSAWSDRRLKENVRKVGETDKGLPIYKFRYKGEDKDETHIGYMADDVEKKHPDAVGEKDGYKYVDYDKVNSRESMGGAVHDGGLGRANFKEGGPSTISETELTRLQQAITNPFKGYLPEGSQLGGLSGAMPRGGSSYVPQTQAHGIKLVTAGSPPPAQKSGMQKAADLYGTGEKVFETAFGRYNPETEEYEGSALDKLSAAKDKLAGWFGSTPEAHGGVVPRHGYSQAGVIPRKNADESEYFPQEILEDDKKPELKTAGGGGGGGGKSGSSGIGSKIGSVIGGLAGSFFGPFGTAAGSALGGLGGSFIPVATGGVVPRQHFGNGGADDPHSDENILSYLIGKETGGKNVQNPDTSASGLLQFTDSTGRTVLQRNPEIVQQLQQQGVKYDPNQRGFVKTLPEDIQRQMGLAHIRQQKSVLQEGGYEPTRENVRMNWFLGESGGPAFLAALKEDPNAPATSIAGPDQIAKNQTIFFKQDGTPRTISEVYALQTQGGGGMARGRQIATAQTTPSAQGGLGQAASTLGDLWSAASKYAAPIGKGILTAASSQSPHARVAIAQGIGAGLAAMQPAEAAQAAIKKVGEETGLVEAQKQAVQAAIDKGAAIFGPAGQLMGFRVYVNGKITRVSAQEFNRALREGRPYQTAPEPGYSGGAGGPGAVAGTGAAGTQTGAAGVGAQAAAGQGPQLEQRPAAQVAPYQGLDQNMKQLLDERVQQVNDAGPDLMKTDKTSQPFNSQEQLANQSRSQTTNRNQFVNAIASVDPSYAGKFPEQVKIPLLQWVTSTARGFGVPDNVLNSVTDLNQLSNSEVLTKIRQNASFDRTDAVQQRSFDAFMESLKGLPGQANSPQSAAILAADLMIAAQRQIDLNNFYNQARDYAAKTGATSGMDQYIGRGLEEEFNRRQQDTYAAEKKALADMRFTKINIPTKSGQTQSMNLLQYLSSNGGNVDPKTRAMIEKEFGPNILRYFGGR